VEVAALWGAVTDRAVLATEATDPALLLAGPRTDAGATVGTAALEAVRNRLVGVSSLSFPAAATPRLGSGGTGISAALLSADTRLLTEVVVPAEVVRSRLEVASEGEAPAGAAVLPGNSLL
jgi:hypothetical protein